ncbi:uncharacterized protein LOC135165314 [Diachasmimorpha longicaudata]|uniref:uncharacterized protein LOC135165314 n=1 Tax=Diachasmimorpha longicaudata TaxID=58733 RepID=UPI0030B8F83C
MRACKEVLVAIFLVLPIHMAIGRLPVTTLGISSLNWAVNTRNILKTGSDDTFGLWEDDLTTLKNLNILFDERSKLLFDELEEAEQVQEYLQERFLKGNAELSAGSLRNHTVAREMMRMGRQLQLINKIPTELTNLKVLDPVIPQQLCRWASGIVTRERISKKIDRFFNRSFPERNPGWLTHLVEDIAKDAPMIESRCGQGYSLYDYLHTIYDLVILTEMRAYIAEGFAHYLLHTYNSTAVACAYSKGDWDRQLEHLYRRLRIHVQTYNNVFIRVLEYLSKEFRECDDDSKSFERDVTYFELEGAMQRYIHAHNPDSSEITGRHLDCSLLDRRYNSQSCSGITKSCSAPVKYPCMGYMIDCEALTTNDVHACVTAERPRRYEWINDSNGVPVRNCQTRTFQKGTSCLCTCIDNDVDSISTHLFNLQPVEADVDRDMVVTGIRFTVHNGVMQLQIQQGKLGPFWEIEGLPEWKPVNDISEQIRAKRLGRKLRGESPEVEEGSDYLIVKEGTEVQLDTLSVPTGHVLTGVKFDLVQEGGQDSSRRVQIGVFSMPFNVTNGRLKHLDTRPTLTRPDSVKRTQLVFPTENVINPLPVTKFSGSNQWVSIITSNMKNDGGQTTLPYFDAKPVVSDPPSALGGVGIFHKSGGNFTGFVALKCVSLDYVPFMNEHRVFPHEGKIGSTAVGEIKILRTK